MTALIVPVMFTLGLLAAPLAQAQPAKVYQPGILSPAPLTPPRNLIESLGELGYVEGRNLMTLALNLKTARARYANSLRALIAMDHITADLPRLARHRVPVLLVGGDRDPSLGPMRVMHRKIRGSRLVVLSPATHFANRDQPEAWNRAVLDFLARCEARARRRRA